MIHIPVPFGYVAVDFEKYNRALYISPAIFIKAKNEWGYIGFNGHLRLSTYGCQIYLENRATNRRLVDIGEEWCYSITKNHTYRKPCSEI